MLTLNYTRSLKRFSLSLTLCPSLSHFLLSLSLLSLPLFRSCCLCRDSFVFAIEFSLRCVAILLRLAHSHPLAVSLTLGTPCPCLAACVCERVCHLSSIYAAHSTLSAFILLGFYFAIFQRRFMAGRGSWSWSWRWSWSRRRSMTSVAAACCCCCCCCAVNADNNVDDESHWCALRRRWRRRQRWRPFTHDARWARVSLSLCVCVCVCECVHHTRTHEQLHIKHIKLRFINNVSNLWFGSCCGSDTLAMPPPPSLSFFLSPSLSCCSSQLAACHFWSPVFYYFYCFPRTHLGKVQSTHHHPRAFPLLAPCPCPCPCSTCRRPPSTFVTCIERPKKIREQRFHRNWFQCANLFPFPSFPLLPREHFTPLRRMPHDAARRTAPR